MRYVLIGLLRSYTEEPPEEQVWDFGDDAEQARETHQVWSEWMAAGLWSFRNWGRPGQVTWIKPGAFIELNLRVTREFP